MMLKLREVGPPDDLDIEMAALRKYAAKARKKAERASGACGGARVAPSPVAAAGGEGAEGAEAMQVDEEAAVVEKEREEAMIERPQFPPDAILQRLKPAFEGAHAHHLYLLTHVRR
jgi:hypothetical protein